MDNPMNAYEPLVLLIIQNQTLLAAVRSTLESHEPSCRFASAAGFAAARNALSDLSPDLIILEELESSTQTGAQTATPRPPPLVDVVASLAGFAPVVVLGREPQPASLAALIASGSADFIQPSESRLVDASACVEKRLQAARRMNSQLALESAGSSDFAAQGETFGDILRHELNNPLTGILGNAELLLAETRRQNGSPISDAGLKRLETIAALAVRMRETVRRLSQACESREEFERSV
jgi:signal transduction histidine kinase